ncbi:MAG TPA: type II toxin-antitoxin system prevent-host-death family antitoxin [Acetobacteraceae bacterium]|nr:type II toxin-antitoxin system prevent-host-death family antitoxin [Acetobacteraceae bacterium]
MGNVNITEAKAHLSKLVVRAASGEIVRITRRGKTVAQLISAEAVRKPIDVAAVRAIVEAMPMQNEPARKFIRRMRNEARY